MVVRFNSIRAALVAGVLITGLSACEKRETAAEGAGPAERAGQQIDQAAKRAGEELNKVAEKAGKGLQEAGAKLEDKAQEAQKKE